MNHIPLYLAVWVLALSLVAFYLMHLDKRRAKARAWRIPEKTFFLLALLGGSPGAILGMWTFHHKTKHWYFKYGLPLILLAQGLITAFVYWKVVS